MADREMKWGRPPYPRIVRDFGQPLGRAFQFFFFFSSIPTTGLWASVFLSEKKGVDPYPCPQSAVMGQTEVEPLWFAQQR